MRKLPQSINLPALTNDYDPPKKRPISFQDHRPAVGGNLFLLTKGRKDFQFVQLHCVMNFILWWRRFQTLLFELEEFQKHLRERGYPRNLIILTLSEIHFENRKEALRQKPSREKTILPFVTQDQPSVPSLKNILMKHWQLIEKQPLLRQIYKEPPIISYKRGRSLNDLLVKAKL